jgi:hypothetical protein
MLSVMPEYPEYTSDAALGAKGRRIVENIVADKLGWLFREVQKDDLGIDGFVELLRDDRHSQGRLFAVQIKCGHSYLRESTDRGYVYRGESKHLKYWTEYSLPVVLILCNPDTGACNWVEIAPSAIETTPSAWKVIVPFGNDFDEVGKLKLQAVVKRPQPADLIELALYRLLHEKFRRIDIAQLYDMPRDLWGFEFLARIDGALTCITYIFHPYEPFSVADIDHVATALDVTARGCGWDIARGAVNVIVFFIAHDASSLILDAAVVERLSRWPELQYYRATCSFSYGIFVTEIDELGHEIDVY